MRKAWVWAVPEWGTASVLKAGWGKRPYTAACLLGFLLLGVLAGTPSASEVGADEKHPRPTGPELQKAEKEVEEVFGRDIAKAGTPSEKGKLAREILQTAREEQDPVLRFAAMQAARQLAIAAQDGRLAVAIVRETVERYQPREEKSPAERLAEADRLWQQAEGLSGSAKLAKQLEAAEGYLYISAQDSALMSTLWEPRLEYLLHYSELPIPDISKAKWIWGVDPKKCIVKHHFRMPYASERALLAITADDYYDVWINNLKIGTDGTWDTIELYDITKHLKQGENVILVAARDTGGGPMGILVSLRIKMRNSTMLNIFSNAEWTTPTVYPAAFSLPAILNIPKWTKCSEVWDPVWSRAKLRLPQ